MKKIKYIFLLFGLLFSFSSSYDGPKDTQSVVKALYLYNFAISIDWPKEFKKGDFVIGVYGSSSVYDELVKKYKGKPIGAQTIKIKKFTSSSSVSRCHILFIDKDKSNEINSLSKKLKPYSTLIVSEYNNSLSSGAIINFVIKNNKQTYDISKRNAKQYKLVVSSKLIELANSVE